MEIEYYVTQDKGYTPNDNDFITYDLNLDLLLDFRDLAAELTEGFIYSDPSSAAYVTIRLDATPLPYNHCVSLGSAINYQQSGIREIMYEITKLTEEREV